MALSVKELQIGDWVRGTIDFEEVWQWEAEDYVNIDVGFFEPIPLTAEILEKNELPPYEWLKIYFQGEYGNITDFSMRLKYVHELQHALRLCGLNDLADNFKIL